MTSCSSDEPGRLYGCGSRIELAIVRLTGRLQGVRDGFNRGSLEKGV
ncbi:hypothetical protein PZ740_04405 [Rhodospirillales bacterium YIM 152171]|uniref:Uncharacterized protein n=1 Tax=Marinimicrococcus flavescens TaxID=3031815 RepID=A0AAP3XPP9_9PROT|nr:hypothetical protein [Marinimicrococcus flavescens]